MSASCKAQLSWLFNPHWSGLLVLSHWGTRIACFPLHVKVDCYMQEEHLGDLGRKAEGEEIAKPALISYRDSEHRCTKRVKGEKKNASIE